MTRCIPSFSQYPLNPFLRNTRWWLCIFLLLLWCAGKLAAQPATRVRPPPEILILHSYHVGYVWSDDINEGIRSVFRESGLVVQPHVEYMDVRRHPTPEHLRQLYAFYQHKFRDLRFDVIISADNAALEFLLRHHEDLFPQAPVVFCGVEVLEQYHLSDHPLFTGVMEVTEHVPTLALALKLHPKTKRVIAVTDYQPRLEAARSGTADLQKAFPQLEFVFVNPQGLTITALIERIKAFPADSSVCLLDTFFRNRFDETFTHAEGMRLVSQNCPFPVYGVQKNSLGHGIVGGKLNDGFFQGIEVATRALAIVKGKRPADFPILRESPNRFQFDDVQLRRWRINRSLLPPGSLIVNEPASLYSKYKQVIWIVLGFLALQTLVISVLLVSIHHRRKAEAMLRRSEASLEEAQSIAHIGSWEHDLAGFQLHWSNETYRIFGYPQERPAVSFDFFFERVHPDDREAVIRAGEEARASGKPYIAEHRIIRPDGSERWVQQKAELITGRPGTGVRMVGTIQDITDVRHLEEQLRQSQKMEAIGTLAGGVAHDFNNMLTAILGYSNLLVAELSADRSLCEYVEQIRIAGERAASLTRQLLAFSRKQVVEPRILDLNVLVTDIDKMLRRLIGEDIELVTLTGRDLGRIKADPGQMEQVIMNLVINARDAMPKGGKLTIETQNATLDETYAREHLDVAPGTYVMLAVSDTGSGIDAETRSHIFEPFFTTKEQGKGTGLGLSTVYGIVKQCGGSIWVYSEPGRGTAFKIYVPRVLEDVDPAPHPSPARVGASHETILVVEDDIVVRNLVCTTLRKQSYAIIEAENGDDALRILSKHRGKIHLVLSDGVMPGLPVREFIVRLGALLPEAKLLLMSGYTDEAIVRHGLLEPDIAFLQKPFTTESLALKVRDVLAGYPGRPEDSENHKSPPKG